MNSEYVGLSEIAPAGRSGDRIEDQAAPIHPRPCSSRAGARPLWPAQDRSPNGEAVAFLALFLVSASSVASAVWAVASFIPLAPQFYSRVTERPSLLIRPNGAVPPETPPNLARAVRPLPPPSTPLAPPQANLFGAPRTAAAGHSAPLWSDAHPAEPRRPTAAD